MKIRTYASIFFGIFFFQFSYGQMVVGLDTLVGNEWITPGQRYYKFLIDQDGVYRIQADVLTAAGIPASDIQGADIRVFNMGKQVPVFVTTENTFGPSDFIEFKGFKNKGALDQFLFRRPETDMLNPDYSMFTDQNAYYLTLDGNEEPLRVTTISNDISNPPAAELYYWHQEKLVYADKLMDPYFPLEGGGVISYSSFMRGEGFAKTPENIST